jgi:hypothetical protein
MTLAELVRAVKHDRWWDDMGGMQVYCEVDGQIAPLRGISEGVPESGKGEHIVVLTTDKEEKW